jgi:hypothetical protein
MPFRFYVLVFKVWKYQGDLACSIGKFQTIPLRTMSEIDEEVFFLTN